MGNGKITTQRSAKIYTEQEEEEEEEGLEFSSSFWLLLEGCPSLYGRINGGGHAGMAGWLAGHQSSQGVIRRFEGEKL